MAFLLKPEAGFGIVQGLGIIIPQGTLTASDSLKLAELSFKNSFYWSILQALGARSTYQWTQENYLDWHQGALDQASRFWNKQHRNLWPLWANNKK